jgi:hypothetical protein
MSIVAVEQKGAPRCADTPGTLKRLELARVVSESGEYCGATDGAEDGREPCAG